MSDKTLPRFSHLSKEYVKLELEAIVGGVTYNPTSQNVALAFVTVGTDPVSGDWVSGSWETINGDYHARALIGPGAKELAEGQYDMYVRVTDNPEVPIILAGKIEIY